MTTSGRITPQEFVEKWRRSKLTERSASQSHFNDLCHLLGHPTPAQADPALADGVSKEEPSDGEA